MLTGGTPLQLSSLYRTQLTFSRSQTAVGEGQTSCFSFLWNAYSRIVKMEIDQQLEQRINIKFLVKLCKNGPEIHQMLQQVYGECARKERTVIKWVQRFREGREDLKDDARSGRPCTSSGNENIDRVCSLVLSDRRLTVRMTAEELCLGKLSVYTILTEHLDMKKVCAKTVPKLLTPEQKLRRKECCADWKTSEESDEFLERVITGEESWIYDYDIELK